MDIKSWGWISLFSLLLISSIGLYWILTSVVCSLTFFLGFCSYIYVKLGNVDEFNSRLLGNPLTTDVSLEGGIQKFLSKLDSPKRILKSDHRVTGSDLIDSSLQEILGYIIRDYILPWYHLISRDKEFPEVAVRQTAQIVAVNISNRAKEIDWVPYLTMQLVDDAATHLRLYKQSRTKIKAHNNAKTMKGSPLKQSPKKTHKRNKSETDINWHHKSNDYGRDGGSSLDKRKHITLEKCFFDLELPMEGNILCRDSVCEDPDVEKEYLSELVQILLYLLLPDEDFQCKSLRILLREIICNVVILPVIELLSDPDYINQMIIWLCLGDGSLLSDTFLHVLRLNDNCDELNATKEIILKEMQVLRSRDAGGESDLLIKQQLSSLSYVLKLIDNKLLKMDNLKIQAPFKLEYGQPDKIKVDLTLDEILKNNVALSYFMDFVSSLDKQIDLFFYLNIEGWKVSVEQQLSDIHINKMKGISENTNAIYSTIRTTALSIFEQYLGEKCDRKVDVSPSLVQQLHFKIRNLNEVPSDQWFDEVQNYLHEKMENGPDCLPAFKKSKTYIRLLKELDLYQQGTNEDDNISLNSEENVDINEIRNPSPFDIGSRFLTAEAAQKSKHARSFSDVDVVAFVTDKGEKMDQDVEVGKEEEDLDQQNLKTGNFVLDVNIIETGIVCEKGKTFGIYAIRVSREFETGYLEEWHIYRRYSDFHDLYTKVKEKYPDLSKLPFPGKKTFHNMERSVLERRMKMLGHYMKELCRPDVTSSHPSLKDLLMTFLEQGEYDRATGGPISATINTLVNPIKSGMKTIKNMPEQLINTMDEVVGGLSKVFNTKSSKSSEPSKVGAGIEETDDNIPLRIVLLLMDEVFDLKSRNQWLRRRIVTLLRQIVRTMFGDIVNRKILDYVSYITSPENVANYLYVFKQSFWPNGNKYETKPERDIATKYRTRVAAKVALLSCLSDELKHIIGSETTRRGLLMVFELFQKPMLNRRLLYVLLEGIVCTLFPEKDFQKIFCQLHSKSKRLKNYKKNAKN